MAQKLWLQIHTWLRSKISLVIVVVVACILAAGIHPFYQHLFVESQQEQSVVVIREQDEIDTEAPTDSPQEDVIETSLWPRATISEALSSYGSFLAEGMAPADYNKAMDYKWEKVNVTGEVLDLTIDLTKAYTYDKLVDFMFNLARNEGVELYIIGRSSRGKNIYALSIDFQPQTPESHRFVDIPPTKPAILFTGQVHASEFAGSVYILKQFSDLVKEAQVEPATMALLERVRFEAIPIVNPDIREEIIAGKAKNQKSNANGVDLNRNFPSVNASQLAHGAKRTATYTATPGPAFYMGSSLGSEPETQAVMKWLEVHVPQAAYFLDYHQQGRGLFYGKPWDTKAGGQNLAKFGQAVIRFLNRGVSSRKYIFIPNEQDNGINGSGGTITDYAMSIARGFTYSPNYGVLTLDIDGIDTPLLQFRDLDLCLEHYNPKNEAFCAAAVEITRREGFGNPLGYSAEARKLMNEEYYRHNYDELLKYLAQLALGLTN